MVHLTDIHNPQKSWCTNCMAVHFVTWGSLQVFHCRIIYRFWDLVMGWYAWYEKGRKEGRKYKDNKLESISEWKELFAHSININHISHGCEWNATSVVAVVSLLQRCCSAWAGWETSPSSRTHAQESKLLKPGYLDALLCRLLHQRKNICFPVWWGCWVIFTHCVRKTSSKMPLLKSSAFRNTMLVTRFLLT